MEVPIYRKIKELILQEIEEKPANSPIESERELAVKYDASRMTVRKAINELVEEGILYRQKNKGTFVADQKLLKKNTAMQIFQNEDTFNFNVLYFNVMEADADIAERLEIEILDWVLRVVRLNTKNEKAQSVEEIYFIRKDIPDEDRGNLNKLLDFNVYINEGSLTQRFVPMIVPVKYANLLKLKLNTPIIMVDTLILSKNGKPLVRIKAFNNPFEKIIEITS